MAIMATMAKALMSFCRFFLVMDYPVKFALTHLYSIYIFNRNYFGGIVRLCLLWEKGYSSLLDQASKVAAAFIWLASMEQV